MFLKTSWSASRIFFYFNLTIILVIFIIGFRPQAFFSQITSQNLAYYNGQSVVIRGRICEEAEINIKNQRLVLCNQGRVLITTSLYPRYAYGNFLKVRGGLQAPPKVNDFDYQKYLARYDIYSVMYYPKIEKISGVLNISQQAYRLLLDFKQDLRSLFNSALPEPEASLANAILLGYRRTIPREYLNIFSRAGLSHLIAISGAHITILSALIINFLLILGFRRQRSLFVVISFLIIYPVITGLGASAIRAAIMGILAILAVYYQRGSSLIQALVFAAALMLIINPRLLRADLGFQLSFLALLGIIYIYPLGLHVLQRLLTKLKLNSPLQKLIKIILETMILTLVAQIVILPVVLINFKQISLIAPLTNVLVLWAFPPLLASLIIALILSTLMPWGLLLWFSLPYFLLKFIFIIATTFAAGNYAVLSVAHFNWYWGTIYYLLLILLVRWWSSKISLSSG